MTGTTQTNGDAIGADGVLSETTQLNEAPLAYFRGWPLISITLALMFSSFIIALDNTILGTLGFWPSSGIGSC